MTLAPRTLVSTRLAWLWFALACCAVTPLTAQGSNGLKNLKLQPVKKQEWRFKGLTNLEVVHTNPPKGHTSFKKGKSWIADMKAANALIGFFRDKKGDRYAMVVNQLHGMNKSAKETTDTIEPTFDSSAGSVTAVNWLDGKPDRITLNNAGKSSLTIAGGTGVLLKANAASGPKRTRK